MEKLHGELTSILGTATPAATAPAGRKKKRTMSAAAKKKLSEFHKARWAKIHAAKTVPAVAPKKKFTMSASAKAAISKAAKARWAKIKAAKQ